jgi:hypothetical protein
MPRSLRRATGATAALVLLAPALAAGEPPPVAAPPAPQVVGGSVAGFDVLGDAGPPQLTALRLTRTRLRSGDSTELSWQLNEPALVSVVLERLAGGWIAPGAASRCLVRATAWNASPCLRSHAMARLRRSGTSGRNALRFTGRVGSRALAPGRYRFGVVARDAAGNTSVARRIRFEIDD